MSGERCGLGLGWEEEEEEGQGSGGLLVSIRLMAGVWVGTGSLSAATRRCMRMSLIMKLVALVSSSISKAPQPASRDSMIAAAWGEGQG